jgi:hypothetical protein
MTERSGLSFGLGGGRSRRRPAVAARATMQKLAPADGGKPLGTWIDEMNNAIGNEGSWACIRT